MSSSKLVILMAHLYSIFSENSIFFLMILLLGFLFIYPLMRKPAKRKFTEEQERIIVRGTFSLNLFVYLTGVSLVELSYLLSLYSSGKTSGEHPPLAVVFLTGFFIWGMIRCGAITLKRWRGERTGQPILFEWKTIVLSAMFFSFAITITVFQEKTFQSRESFISFLLIIPMFCFLIKGYWDVLSDRFYKMS